MSRHYWIAFVIAGGFAAGTGFPVQSGLGVLDLHGLAFLAQFLVFVGFCGVAIAVYKEAVDARRALGISLMVWLACAAISEANVGGIRWLLPFPIIVMVTWPRAPLPADGMLTQLPEPVRQGLSVIAAIVGSDMITSGLARFNLIGMRFDYLGLFFGALVYGLALILLLKPINWRIVARIGIGSYSACLLLFSLVRIVEISTAPVVRAQMIFDLVICAMLLTQAWRHFLRRDGWLKLIETVIGGAILSMATKSLLEWENANDLWILLGVPFAIFAAGMVIVALTLIWSDRIWLKWFGRRFTSHASPT